MSTRLLTSVSFVLLLFSVSSVQAQQSPLRPPSVPLVTVDPYFSIWSPANRLTDAETEHWSGRKHPLHLMVRIDGKPYRLMGAEPVSVPAMKQKNLEVGPLTTKYVFENEAAEFTVTFTTPFLPNKLYTVQMPMTLITVSFESKDSKKHDIGVYFDAGAEITVNTPDQTVVEQKVPEKNDIGVIAVGTDSQNYLGRRGDDVRIDWGYLALAVRNTSGKPLFGVKTDRPYFAPSSRVPMPILKTFSVRNGEKARNEFATTGELTSELEPEKVYRVDESHFALTTTWEMRQTESMHLPIILYYYDVYSIRYFGEDIASVKFFDEGEEITNELPLEEKLHGMADGMWSLVMLENFHDECREFEKTFFEDLTAVGGKDYAQLCALAYRHAFAAQKVVTDSNRMPLMFSKENNSNGSIGTVDLMYPCSPLLLYYSPALQKATMQPIFDYANTEKWKFPFAPHDVGTYPHATGQTYGGAERSEENQMPVEESANMIIQVAALAVAENKADYAALHWDTLTRWADYLLEKGFDPENQLCTDDFAGHLAHNVNLSAKAIVAIAAYAQLAEKLGKTELAKKYRNKAEEFAARWVKEADDGDHYRLAFDKPGSWSMKYNLMWDDILELNLFPKEVMQKEIAYYKTQMRPYGLPLDNRSLYTKNDWILWIATMCENETDFNAFVDPVVRYVNETPSRVPLSDWYYTDSARQVGFKARSVVGAFWAPMLKDKAKWQAQAAKGAKIEGEWAPITLPGKPIATIAETAETAKVNWRYTTNKPNENWTAPDFDDGPWREGVAGFGTRNTPGVIIGTTWSSRDLWIRRTFQWDGEIPENAEFALNMHHDDDVEVYVNGVNVFSRTGYTSSYEIMNAPKLREALKKGVNTIAVHCHQDHGGQYIDVGIVLTEKKKAR